MRILNYYSAESTDISLSIIQLLWHFSPHNYKQSDYNMTDGKTHQRRKRLRY